jgi:hypothetical protein
MPSAVEIPLAVSVASPLLPYAMGFAAGAMLFVISDEIIPETHTRGERIATLGTMVGVTVMLYLDVVWHDRKASRGALACHPGNHAGSPTSRNPDRCIFSDAMWRSSPGVDQPSGSTRSASTER